MAALAALPGLFIIDSLHFQYNGILYAILIATIHAAKLVKYIDLINMTNAEREIQVRAHYSIRRKMLSWQSASLSFFA
jgi:hypothetical protein